MLGLVGVGAGDDLADVAVLRTRRPHLLPGEDPFVAVARRARLDTGEVGTGDRLREQLAADDLAAPQRPEVRAAHLVDRVGEDRRRDHPEPDGEWPLARSTEPGLDLAVRAIVRGGEPAAAVLGRPGDPAEPGVEDGLAPRLRRVDLGLLLLTRLLVEQAHLVGALAPLLPFRGAAREPGGEEPFGLGAEVVDRDGVAHFGLLESGAPGS